MIKLVLSLIVTGWLAAVSTSALEADSPVIVGQTFLAGGQDPTGNSDPWALISHGIAEKLFVVNESDEIVPQIAESVKKVEGIVQEVELGEEPIVWEVVLKPYKFSDGKSVTTDHVVSCLSELNEKNPSASSSLGKMSLTAVDDRTIRIESERPTHVMDAVLAEWVFVIYYQDDDGNFIYTGPYKVDTFADDHIDLSPNRFYDAQSLDRPSIEIKKYATGEDLAKDAETGDIDIAFHLPIDTLPELRKADGVNVKSFEVGYYYMMFHNINRISDVKVRKAIDLAIDRIALSQALAGGKATRLLFPDYSPYFIDDSDAHGDADAAAALLGDAGWILNSDDGKRYKDGKELTVTLVAYPHRPGLGIMQPLIAEQLEDIGFTVNSVLTGMDWSETQAYLDDETFDLMLWAQHTLPAGDPLWFLSSFFRSDGGNNHANIASTDIDNKLDDLSIAEGGERIAQAKVTHETVLDLQPVSNLVTPYWHVGLSDRMADYQPYGADYYVIRPDLFVKQIATDGDEEVAVLEDDTSGSNKLLLSGSWALLTAAVVVLLSSLVM